MEADVAQAYISAWKGMEGRPGVATWVASSVGDDMLREKDPLERGR